MTYHDALTWVGAVILVYTVFCWVTVPFLPRPE